MARVTLYAVRAGKDHKLEIREWVLWEMEDYFTHPGGWKVMVAKDDGEPVYPWRRTPERAVEAFVRRREIRRQSYLIRAEQEADEIREAKGLLG
jgi:hypothetical protein